MHIATVKLTGTAPYSQSKPHREEKRNKEGADDYEARTWQARMHVNQNGELILPAMSVKNCLAEAAKFLGMQIPGKGKSTYTKHFESGVLVPQSPVIYGKNGEPLLKSDCDRKDEQGNLASQIYGDWIFTPADGVRGSGKRVYKCYPVILPPWRVQMDLFLIDDTITEDILKIHLDNAGLLIGLGRFRVRNLGSYGQFKAEILQWKEQAAVA